MAFTNEEVMRMTELALKQYHVVSKDGGISSSDIEITEMESGDTYLSVKYFDETSWTTYNYSIDTAGTITFTCSNGWIIELEPLESIYNQA